MLHLPECQHTINSRRLLVPIDDPSCSPKMTFLGSCSMRRQRDIPRCLVVILTRSDKAYRGIKNLAVRPVLLSGSDLCPPKPSSLQPTARRRGVFFFIFASAAPRTGENQQQFGRIHSRKVTPRSRDHMAEARVGPRINDTRMKRGRRCDGQEGEGGAISEPSPKESASLLRVHEWGLNPLFWVSSTRSAAAVLVTAAWTADSERKHGTAAVLLQP